MYTILLSFRSLAGQFAAVGSVLLLPQGLPALTALLAARAPEDALGSSELSFQHHCLCVETGNPTDYSGWQTPAFSFAEPQVQLPASKPLQGISCVTTHGCQQQCLDGHLATELWSAAPVKQKCRVQSTGCSHTLF